MQNDNFCPGTEIWIWKCPDNLFGQIYKLKVYKSTYDGVSGKNAVKLAFILTVFSQNHNRILRFFL